MADSTEERAVKPENGRLELLMQTPAKKGIDDEKAAAWKCNIILVPGGSSTTSTAPIPSDTNPWPWLDHSPDGPAARLSSYLSLRKIPVKTFIYNYSVPQTRQGISIDTVREVARDLLGDINTAIPSLDSADDLDGVDDYKDEEQLDREAEEENKSTQSHASGSENGDGIDAEEGRSVHGTEEGGEVGGEEEDKSVTADGNSPKAPADNVEETSLVEADQVLETQPTDGEQRRETTDFVASNDDATTNELNSEEVETAQVEESETVPPVVVVEPVISEDGTEAPSTGFSADEAHAAETKSLEDFEPQSSNPSEAPGDNLPATITAEKEDDDASVSDVEEEDDESQQSPAEEDSEAPQYFVFVAQDLGGLVVKEALSLARTTMGPYQFVAACTTLLLFHETPCPSTGHESTWDSLANWLLSTSQQGMLFSTAWIHNTAHMIESVCADFALSEPIYRVINLRCSAHDLAPFLRVDPLYHAPSKAAIISLGEEILRLKRTPFRFMSMLNTLSLVHNGVPRSTPATAVSDGPRRARMAALRREPGVSAWTSDETLNGFSGFIVRNEDEASVLFEVLQRDSLRTESSARLSHLAKLDLLKPVDQGEKETQLDTASLPGAGLENLATKAVVSYVFDPYNKETNTSTALLASLCYQLICMRRHSFTHTSELAYYLNERSRERIWPFDKLLIMFRSLLSCPYEGSVSCILWEMPGTVLPQGLVSTLAILASGPESSFKLSVISSRAEIEFPSVPSTPVAPAKRISFASLTPPIRPLARAPTWATNEPHVYRLPHRSVDLPAIVDREIASLLGRRPAMKSVQEKLRQIILKKAEAEDSDNDNGYDSEIDGETDSTLFSGSHAEVVASVRAWLELITHRAVPISIASIAREAPKMPTSMAGLYAATLSYTPPSMLFTVQQLLAWLSLAKRPLTKAELAVALAVTYVPGTEEADCDDSRIHVKTMDELDAHKPVNVQDDLLALLGSAVNTDDSGRPLLQAELIDLLGLDRAMPGGDAPDEKLVIKYSLPDAHNTLACICLAFLRICQDEYPRMTSTIIKDQPFFEYAILHWPYHYSEGSLFRNNTEHGDTPSVKSCLGFFEDSKLMEFWASLYHQLRHPGLNPPEENITLSMAADAGCLDLISRVLQYSHEDVVEESAPPGDQGEKLSVSPSGLSRALLFAVKKGDVDAVKLLERAGAKSRFAVHVAVASNQNALLHHFGPLEDIATVKDWRKYTPVQIAAATGNVEALEELLPSYVSPGLDGEHEYETDTDDYENTEWDYDSEYYCPYDLPILHIACMFGQVAVVERLLQEKTIDPHEFDRYYNRPIFYCGLLQQPDAMRVMLKDPRVDPSLLSDAYYRRSPLQVSAVLERLDMVELILKELQSRPSAPPSTNNTTSDPPDATLETKDDASETSNTSLTPPEPPKTPLQIALQVTDRFSLTALHIAAYFGQVRMGKSVLAHGADGFDVLKKIGYQMAIPLHIAAHRDNTGFIKLLLDNGNVGAQLEEVCRDGNGQTALHICARFGNSATSMRLLVDAHVEAGITLDAFDSGPRSALHYAAIRGSAAKARLLLNAGATPDAVDSESATPLLIACRNGFADVVQILLEKKADIALADYSGITPLLAAASVGSVPIMKALLERTTSKALLEADNDGKNALHYAVMSKSHEAVVFVIQSMSPSSRTQRTVHSTVERPGSQGDQIIFDRGELLVDNSTGSMPIEASAEGDLLRKLLPAVKHHVKDLDSLDSLCQTLLLRAASVGHMSNIEMLVQEYHVNLDAVDKEGRTALSYAAESGRVGLVLYLAEKTKPGKDSVGRSPLAYAIMNNHTRVAKVLLRNGHEEEVKMADETNESPLYMAVYKNNEELVKLLLKHNADPNTPESNNNNTPLHGAVMYASVEIVRLIASAPGVDGYARNNDDRTPMGIAAYYGVAGEARALLEAGWKSDDRKSSRHSCPLHDAYENEELIRLFVGEGEQDIDAVDSMGRTALYLASKSSRGKVSVLLELGANPMIVEDEDHETSLHAAAYYHDKKTFVEMMNHKNVPSLSQLKYIKSKSDDNIFDMAVNSDNTAVIKYLLEAEDSPFRAVEQSNAGAKSLQRAIRNNFQDTTRVLLERVKEDVKQLTDDMKRSHLGVLLEAVFQNVSFTLTDMERLSKELLLDFAETRDDGGMANREAWPYMFIFDAVMASDQYKIHVRRPFPQLMEGSWAHLRDRNGWTYPQLMSTMEEIDDGPKEDADSDLDSLASVPEELPPAEERLLFGLEKVSVTDEDLASMSDRPASPKLPTSWSVALSHDDLMWTRPVKTTDEDAGNSAKETDNSDKNTGSTVEDIEDPDKKPERAVKAPEEVHDDSAPKLYVGCPEDSMYYSRYLAIADHAIPPNSKYHFSFRVVNEGESKITGAGVGYQSAPNHRMPGWEYGTWGMHGDDGGFFHEVGYGMRNVDDGLYGTGDTVVVYVDTTQHKLFFAVNGKVVNVGFERVYGRLYPMVGLGDGASLEATFGDLDDSVFFDDDGNALIDQVTEWL